MKKILYFLPTIFLLIIYCLKAEYEKEEVVKVIDGDTVELSSGEKIRLFGIDAPEKGEPFFQEAKQALEEMVKGKRVVVEKEGKDKYGRFLGYILLEGKVVNCELVKLGVVKIVEEKVKYKCFPKIKI